MKTDQKVAQPAPSPQAGEVVFPVEQAGLEEKPARTRVFVHKAGQYGPGGRGQWALPPPSFPSPSAGDLRELPRVPLGG